MKPFHDTSAPALVPRPPRARSDRAAAVERIALAVLIVCALWGALIFWLLRFV
jgi:hypothetical protein